MKQQKILRIGLLVLLCSVLLYLRFPDFFQHGNSMVIEPWGDGYKTYHALSYHVQHDTSLTRFEGMNYPYGEHVVPGDCQPFISNGIKILASIGIDLSSYSIAILHGSLLLGFVLCALFLYLIFIRLKLPWWYAIPAAIGLSFLAPQAERMISHYGLAHPEVLPIAFYFLMRWDEDEHWKWSLFLGIAVWVYSAIHFYFFAILSFTIGGFMLLRWLMNKDWSKTLLYFGNGVLMLGLPLLFFYCWMMHNDPVLDRNPVPWGFYHYKAYLSGALTHLDQPHWQLVSEHLRPLPRMDIEWQSYLGLAAIFGTLFLTFRWAINKFQGFPFGSTGDSSNFLRVLFWTAFFIWLFAFGLPFTLTYGDKLLKYAGPIQQFRSIGRFAWVFYYAINIIVLYELFIWAKRQTSLLRFAPLLAVGVLCLEAFFYINAKNLSLDPIEEYTEGQRFLDIDSIDFTQYQAIVPIPYYNIGSDNFWWELKGFTGQKSQTLSFQTGLPLTAAMLTRTSLSQTLNQLQLVSEPYRLPKLLNDLSDERPFIMLWDAERVKEYPDKYDHLMNASKLIYQKPPLFLYELTLESFNCRIREEITAAQTELDSSYKTPNNWLLSDSLGQWFYNAFSKQKSDSIYYGEGAFQGTMTYWNRLVDTVWQSDYTGEIRVSYWQYLNADRSPGTTITWREIDPESGGELHKMQTTTHHHVKVFDSNGWGLIEFTLPKIQANSRIELILTNPALDQNPIYVDELLIRSSSLNIGRKSADGFWWNNRWYSSELIEEINKGICN